MQNREKKGKIFSFFFIVAIFLCNRTETGQRNNQTKVLCGSFCMQSQASKQNKMFTEKMGAFYFNIIVYSSQTEKCSFQQYARENDSQLSYISQ